MGISPATRITSSAASSSRIANTATRPTSKRAFPADASPSTLTFPRHAAECITPRQHPQVVVGEGIPDTLSVLRAGIAACGLYDAQGWREVYRARFRRCDRVYVALDRDAVEKSITLAREFGVRGRVIVPPEDLGAKGDMNDWLCSIAKGDPEVFRRLIVGAMEESLTSWALGIEGLPTVPRRRLWEIEDAVKLLLADLAPLSPIFRDSHLLLMADKTGLPFATLVAACQEVADKNLEDRTTATGPVAPFA